MVKRGPCKCGQWRKVAVQAQTICLHGDGEKAVQFAKEYTEHSNLMIFLFVHRNKNREVLG